MKIANLASLLQDVQRSCPNLDLGKFTAKSSFRKSGLDSMNIASLMLEIEESYGVKIPDSEVDKLDTVEEVSTYILERSTKNT